MFVIMSTGSGKCYACETNCDTPQHVIWTLFWGLWNATCGAGYEIGAEKLVQMQQDVVTPFCCVPSDPLTSLPSKHNK